MKKTLCKLTDENGRTCNNTQWGEGITHTSSGEGNLCSSGWIHFYDDPLLAVLLNPIHGNFENPILWEIEVSGAIKEDHGLKFGANSVTTIKTIKLPIITTEQKVRFAILCSLEVYKEKSFVLWAKNWLSGIDRSAHTAAYAADAADTVHAAVYAVHAAAHAAAHAADAAHAAAYAAHTAAYAAAHVADAAHAAVYAAHAAFDLSEIAMKALEVTP